MSKWLSLAEVENESQLPCDSVTKPDKTPLKQPAVGLCQVLSECQVGSADNLEAQCPDQFRHGFTFTGRPKTWTGKIVSLDEWRRLSAWDRHGPDGRVWNGKTRAWEVPQS